MSDKGGYLVFLHVCFLYTNDAVIASTKVNKFATKATYVAGCEVGFAVLEDRCSVFVVIVGVGFAKRVVLLVVFVERLAKWNARLVVVAGCRFVNTACRQVF